MGKVLFVSIDKIKEKAVFGLNTDEKIIKTALAEVQDLELQPLIGDFFNTLSKEIEYNTLSDENKKILTDVIQPYLVYGTLVYSVVPLHYKLNNAGLNKSSDSSLNISDAKDVSTFQGYYKEKFESYKRRLIEYFRCDENDETITSISEDTTSSILNFYLPDAYDYSKEYNESRAYKTGLNRW